MAKVSEQKPALAGQATERTSSQLLSASRVASQVPCEPKSPLPKQMWRPKQKALYEVSGVATPQVRLSREDKDKMPACFVETISCEARTATILSPYTGAVTPRANLVLPSKVTDSMTGTAPVPQGTRGVPSHQAGAKAPSSANHLHNKVANKAPQRASLPSSSSIKFALRGGAKGLSLGADSGAYAASAPKGAPEVLSLEVRAKALSNANHHCGDERNNASTCVSFPKFASKKVVSKLPERINARSTRVSALSHLNSAGSDLREFLASKRKSKSFQTSLSCCQQVGCQLVTVHSVHCQLGPIPSLL